MSHHGRTGILRQKRSSGLSLSSVWKEQDNNMWPKLGGNNLHLTDVQYRKTLMQPYIQKMT